MESSLAVMDESDAIVQCKTRVQVQVSRRAPLLCHSTLYSNIILQFIGCWAAPGVYLYIRRHIFLADILGQQLETTAIIAHDFRTFVCHLLCHNFKVGGYQTIYWI